MAIGKWYELCEACHRSEVMGDSYHIEAYWHKQNKLFSFTSLEFFLL